MFRLLGFHQNIFQRRQQIETIQYKFPELGFTVLYQINPFTTGGKEKAILR